LMASSLGLSICRALVPLDPGMAAIFVHDALGAPIRAACRTGLPEFTYKSSDARYGSGTRHMEHR
jgi:hypothetical protein